MWGGGGWRGRNGLGLWKLGGGGGVERARKTKRIFSLQCFTSGLHEWGFLRLSWTSALHPEPIRLAGGLFRG